MVQHVQYFRVIVLQYERQRDEEIEHVSWLLAKDQRTRGLLKRIQTSKFSHTTLFNHQISAGAL